MQSLGASPVAQMVKNLPAVQETRLQSLWWEDPLEEEMATHSSILAWRILWTQEPGRLQSLGSQRVGHNGTHAAFETNKHTNTSFMPRAETTGSLGEVNTGASLIWDCLAQAHARGPTHTLVHLPWTERNAFQLPEPRGGSPSSSVHWEICVMFRQPQCLVMTLAVSFFPQYSHTPYCKKAQIPYLNTVIKLPTSNDSWDRAASHLSERLIQRWQISACKSFLKFILDVPNLGGILLISIIPVPVIQNQLSQVWALHTLVKKHPCFPQTFFCSARINIPFNFHHKSRPVCLCHFLNACQLVKTHPAWM